jgi:general secretion pathway protein G
MNRKRKGFTLIELIAVAIIIALMAGFMAPKIFKKFGKAKGHIAIGQIAQIAGALEGFAIDCGRYPTQTEGLGALVMPPAELEEKWTSPYLKEKQLLDPWGNPFIYIEEGTINPGSYDLICLGADGVEEGEDDNADIFNDR